MTLRETEHHRARSDRERALDDQRVMSLRQWCEVNGFSWELVADCSSPARARKSSNLARVASASLSAPIARGRSRGSGREQSLATRAVQTAASDRRLGRCRCRSRHERDPRRLLK